jgi:taurine--2-oxoglutarate transaminase
MTELPTTHEEIVQLHKDHVFFPWIPQGSAKPISMSRAEGVWFWDADGKKYIDFASQLMNVNVGHGNQRIIDAIATQAQRLAFAYPGMAVDVKGAAAKRIADITPGDINKVLFTLGGAEAIENAIKIARLYTGRHKIITRYRSYHGATAGAITAGGDPRRFAAEPGIPGIVRVMDPYCYRCPFGQEGPDSCGRECISHVEDVIRFEGPENVAAILMEGVTGSSGIILPPDDYWAGIRKIADKYGILIIADEVMSGFGRTGQWFGIDNYGVQPDLITMAKGLTCGYIPLGAVAVSKKIADHFDDKPFACGLTYSGHPVSCAAAIATIDVYEEDGLIEKARERGESLAKHLAALKASHPSVGDVRSIGLFGVIECVKDRQTREPTAPWNAKPSEMGAMAKVAAHLREEGLYTFVRWNWIFTVPPLTISEEELKYGIDIIDRALAHSDAAYTGVPL